jgi:hypothetical protein
MIIDQLPEGTMTAVPPLTSRAERRTGLAIVALALAAYVAACAVPALRFELPERASESPQIMKGFEVALLGWQAIFVGNFGWVANPLLFVSLPLILMRRWRMAAVCATLGLLFALHSLMLLGQRIIADEGGVTHMMLSRLYSGFYLWLTSILIPAAGSIWWWRQATRA